MTKYLGLHCHDLYDLLLDGLAKIVHTHTHTHTHTDAGEVEQIWQEVNSW